MSTISAELLTGKIEVNLPALDGKPFDFSDLGGHHIWFQIRDEAVAALQYWEP